jgi:hypothetical protein
MNIYRCIQLRVRLVNTWMMCMTQNYLVQKLTFMFHIPTLSA